MTTTPTKPARHFRTYALVGSLAALVLSAAGCAGGVQATAPATAVPGGTSSSSTPAPSESATSSPTPRASSTGGEQPSSATSATSSATSSTTAPAGPAGPEQGVCTLGDLDLAVRNSEGGGAAGSQYVALTFHNRSATSCTLYGFPGVSWVGRGNGTQIGAAATRSGDRPTQTVLASGKTTAAVLRIVQAGNYGDSCRQTATDGFRVYPPGSKTSAFVRFAGTGCANTKVTTLEISPIGAS